MSDTPYRDFWQRELVCRCGRCGLGWEDMDPDFMELVQTIRTETGIRMPVTSAVRCPVHDRIVGGSGNAGRGPHTKEASSSGKAKALDSQVFDSARAFVIVQAAMARGFTGLGILQKGPSERRHIHLDSLSPAEYSRPRLWTYVTEGE